MLNNSKLKSNFNLLESVKNKNTIIDLISKMQHHQPFTPTKLGNSNFAAPENYQITTKKIQNYIYNYNDLLGQGNFSKVYKGINKDNNQKVAVKIIELSSITTAKLEELLNSEIQILKTLKHENVVQCFQVLSSQRNCYIVTQLCDGDLSSLVNKKHNNCFQQQEIYKLAWDIFQGLKYLAERNIVHRDLKISNIFMKGDQAKIADFGFAKYAHGLFFDAGIGSPVYMSPQGLIYNTYGPKTDIWAFGIILFQLTHGRTPASYCRTEQQLKNVVRTQITVNDLRGQLSYEFKQLVIKCLDTNQASRISISEISQTNWMRNVERQLNYNSIRSQKRPSITENPFYQNSRQFITSIKGIQLQANKRYSVQSIRQNLFLFPKASKNCFGIVKSINGNQDNKSVNIQNKQNIAEKTQKSLQQQINIFTKQANRNNQFRTNTNQQVHIRVNQQVDRNIDQQDDRSASKSPGKIYRPSQNLLKLIEKDSIKDCLDNLQVKRGSCRFTQAYPENNQKNKHSNKQVHYWQTLNFNNACNESNKQRPKSFNPQGTYPIKKEVDQVRMAHERKQNFDANNFKYSQLNYKILQQEKQIYLKKPISSFQIDTKNRKYRINSSLTAQGYKKQGNSNVTYVNIEKKKLQMNKTIDFVQFSSEPCYKNEKQLKSQQLKFAKNIKTQKEKTEHFICKKVDIYFPSQDNQKEQMVQKIFKPQNVIISDKILPGIIQFSECIGILHYCRLLFKYLLLKRQVQPQSQLIKTRNSNSLAQILIRILCQLAQKVENKQVQYSKRKDTKQSKIRSVVEEYLYRYIRQLKLKNKQLYDFFNKKDQNERKQVFSAIKSTLKQDECEIYEEIMHSSLTELSKNKQKLSEIGQEELNKLITLGFFCITLIPISQKIEQCSKFSVSNSQFKNPSFRYFLKPNTMQQVMEMDKSDRTLDKYLRIRRSLIKSVVENQINNANKHLRSQVTLTEIKNQSAPQSSPQPHTTKENQSNLEIKEDNLSITENTSFFRDITMQSENCKGISFKYEFYSNSMNKADLKNSGETSEDLMNILKNLNRPNPAKIEQVLQRKPSQKYAGLLGLENVNTIYKIR